MVRPPFGAFTHYLPDGTRTRHIAGTVAALAAIALALGVIVGVGSSAGASTPTKAAGATIVQRRDLVATDTEAGTLSYANAQTVFNRVTGTITWLPAIGAEIKPGGTLYKVDGNPIVLFDGTVPAYRDLSEGVSDGPDVQQLKQNLANLGFNPGTINQTFDAGTASAVDSWQASLGETQTGTVTLGQVVFLPGAQRITSVNTVLGSNGATSGSGGSSAAGSSSSGSGTASSGTATTASATVAPHAEYVSLTTTTATTTPPRADAASCSNGVGSQTQTTTTPTTPTTPTTTCPGGSSNSRKSQAQTLAALVALLKAETKELRQSRSSTSTIGSAGRGLSGASTGATGASSRSGAGASGSSAGASSGASGSGGTSAASGSSASPILQTTSTQLVVTVDLDATKQTEAVDGEPVTVELPDGSNADGRITQVSPVAQASSSSSSGATGGAASGTPSATVPVTITLTSHHVKGLDQAAVSVNFEQQVERGVLSVPVTALVATAGGGYAVQEASVPHRLIPVTPGLFAAGYVQISGDGVFSGLQVTDSQG